jgi:hypothetical protein
MSDTRNAANYVWPAAIHRPEERFVEGCGLKNNPVSSLFCWSALPRAGEEVNMIPPLLDEKRRRHHRVRRL